MSIGYLIASAKLHSPRFFSTLFEKDMSRPVGVPSPIAYLIASADIYSRIFFNTLSEKNI